jgi:hypothetical protein
MILAATFWWIGLAVIGASWIATRGHGHRGSGRA